MPLLQREESALKTYESLVEELRRSKRNEDHFQIVADRLKPILSESHYRLPSNNCEHLANFLLNGCHCSRQIEQAHFAKRILIHMIGPIGEVSIILSIFYIVPPFVVLILATYLHERRVYAICIMLIYVCQFLPAAWTISGSSVSLGTGGRSPKYLLLIYEVFLRSSMNASAFSIGTILGHWYFTCSPTVIDDFLVATALYVFSHIVAFPLIAAFTDFIAYRYTEHHPDRVRCFLFFVLALLIPLVLAAPFLAYAFWY